MQGLYIELYNPDKAQIWDDFVDDSHNGTIFHKQKFLHYHKDKFKDNTHHLLFYHGKKLISVLPLAIFESEGKKIAKSPYGGSFGGFVYKKAIYSNISKIVKSFKEYATENKFDEIVITLPPLIYHRHFENYQDLCLLNEEFKLINRELTNIISLKDIKPERLFDDYNYSFKSKIRKAVKAGFIAKKVDDLDEFYKVLLTRYTKFDKIPTHSLEELHLLKKTFPESLHVFGTYKEDELVASVLCLSINKRVAMSFYICHKEEYIGFGITALALHNSMHWVAENNFDFFDLGISTANMIPNEGLLLFKESFGSSAIFRDTFTLEL